MQLTWGYRGAVLGLLFAVGYNTDGGRAHLSLGGVVFCAGVGFIVGVVLASLGRRPPAPPS